MIQIHLPENIEVRLGNLVRTTGKSQDFYIKQASEEYLDDMKDFYLSLAVLDDIKSDKEKLLTEEPFTDKLSIGCCQ